jgi:DDE superfamily endonuclease
LGCFLCFAAGGSVYDNLLSFGIGRADVSKSIWNVVDAINLCSGLDLIYPTSHVEQQRIADEFKAKLFAGFDRCAGALDGLLVWTQRPLEEDAKLSGCVVAKSFCGRKHKYGLNCQAISNARSKFLDVSVMFPGSTSDVLSFELASIFKRLENGLLAPGVYIVHC